MGFIVLLQAEFLKFEIENKIHTVIACFLTAILEAIIVILLMVYDRKATHVNISRENYLDLHGERPREPS